MKNVIFLFIGFFCFANAQSDSLKIAQQLNRLEQVNNQTKIFLKKTETLEKQNQTLIYRIKIHIEKLITRNKSQESESLRSVSNNNALVPFNVNKPVIEIEAPDGIDSIRGSFFYRLFHKNYIILKPYKIVNDEKIYLD